LPELTREHLQEDLAAATTCLQNELMKTIDFDEQHDKAWRNNPAYFRFPKPAQFQPGSVDLSPSWFQQHKDVCRCFTYVLSQEIHCLPVNLEAGG
jgi:hypothetical protein